MSKPKIYPDRQTYRLEYNSRPEVKERQRIHVKKWKSKPEVKIRLREYNREYMKYYWKSHPEKYQILKLRVAEGNRERTQQRRRFQNVV
jgi:hypothetical protein